MPYADSAGVRLYYEEAGKGTPIVFVHEFADDLHSWEPQMRFFSRRYRCIAYNARGYPPSDVPKARSKYSQAIATDDIANVMRHLGLRKAHIIGCSMGGYATVHFGLRYAKLALSLTAIGVGYGSDPDKRKQFLDDTEVMARRFEELGTPEAIKPYQIGPSRVQFQNKDPRGFAHFCAEFAKHSALGSANTLRGVQAQAPDDPEPRARACEDEGAAAHRDRRRRQQLPRAGHLHQARVPVGVAHGRPEYRTRGESRGAGSLQPHHGRISRTGGLGTLAAARSAFAKQIDDGEAVARTKPARNRLRSR